ncbi:MAG: prephenate dehydratase [Pseudomonadota bacterium]
MGSPDDDAVRVELASIREQIDDVDQRIQGLISERAGLARRVGDIKAAAELRTVDYFRPEREAEVLREVVARNANGPLSDEEMVRLFREIMSACLAQQEPLKIAYLGPEGTFTQTAVLRHFGHSVRDLPLATIDEVFQEVEAAHADFGVVPVENSTEGSVNNTLDMLISSPLKIGGEIELRIEQHLMAKRGVRIDSIERICGHQQSLAQCRAWLREYLPAVELVPVGSNATGARRARDEVGTAAIAGDAAAQVYGLDVLVANIEDRSDNTTRFLVLGRKLLSASGDDKTTLLLSAEDTGGAGALHALLKPFADYNVNLNRIESRPSRRAKWQYVFFLDIDGHAEDENVASAISAIREHAPLCRVLGSYPKALL